MRRLIAGMVALSCGLAFAQTAAKKSSTKKAAPVTTKSVAAKSKAPQKSSTPKTTPAASKTATTTKTARTATRKTVAHPPRRYVQQQPTPDRYKEIQQALMDKGYFSGAPDGNWGPDSVEALKRFQREQNIADDGKIGSLSLIALGLGPKRTQQPSAEASKSSSEQP